MKNIISIGLLLALGCGAVDDASIEPTDDSGELGTAEQAIDIGNGGFGLSTAASHGACAQPGGLGQICSIPGNIGSSVKWCINTNFTGGSVLTGTQVLNAIASGVAKGVQGTPYGSQQVSLASGQCVLEFGMAAVGSGGTSNVANYSTWVPSGLTPLTSPSGVSHVNGSWSSFNHAVMMFDNAKVQAQLPTGTVALKFEHIGAYGTALFLGQGSTTNPNSPTRRNIGLVLNYTPGELCRINGRNSHNSTTVSNTFTCGI